MGLIEDIGDGDVAVDTAAFIYFIEEDAHYLPIVRPLFVEADKGKRRLVTSALTLLEVLVVPYRTGNAPLAGAPHAQPRRAGDRRDAGWRGCEARTLPLVLRVG